MRPNVVVFPDKDTLSRYAAEQIIIAAQQAIARHGQFHLALSGGGTPQPVYEQLALSPAKEQIPWDKTFVFWADERCVPPDDPGSNYRLAQESFLEVVDLPVDHIIRVKGELDPQAAAADYVAQLARFGSPQRPWPALDVAVMGMGADGHTASLFPGSPLEIFAPAVAVTADYDGRPANRVTLTPQVFNDAHLLIFLVTGSNKAKTLQAVLEGPAQPLQLPSQRIQPKTGTILWLIDEPAAQKLSL